jgi:SagB-type dehydrogenase family enzyme
MDFSKLFHQSSKDLTGGGTVHIPKDPNEWPDEWKQVQYKTYATLPRVSLPAPESDLLSLTIKGRKSVRDYAPTPVDLEKLSLLLKFSCGEIGGTIDGARKRRAQPSGGGMFPLELYVLIFRASPELPAGVYHYAVSGHELEFLLRREFTREEIDTLYAYPWVADAGGVFVITGVFDRTQKKYGERGYRYASLEAGHVGQNIYILSSALGVGCCSVAGSHDEKIERLLDIDGVTESVLYSIAFGNLQH